MKIKKEAEEFTYVLDCTKISPGGHIEDCQDRPGAAWGGRGLGRLMTAAGGDFSHKYTSSGGLNYTCISIQTKFFYTPQKIH